MIAFGAFGISSSSPCNPLRSFPEGMLSRSPSSGVLTATVVCVIVCGGTTIRLRTIQNG